MNLDLPPSIVYSKWSRILTHAQDFWTSIHTPRQNDIQLTLYASIVWQALAESYTANYWRPYAVTSGGWNSRANHSYVSVTLHSINNGWELKCFLRRNDWTAYSSQLGKLFRSVVIACWNLPATYINAVVIDIVSNITAAIARLEWQRLSCSSHTLQLSVHKL